MVSTGPRSEVRSCVALWHRIYDCRRSARSAVEDSGDLSPCRKTQAGGRAARQDRAAVSRNAVARQRLAGGAGGRVEARAEPVDDRDRHRSAMSRQFCQRWKLRRLSAPMIQTKCTPGQRARR